MNRGCRGQTNMILIVILLIIFAALALFLLSLSRSVSQEDYMNMYVNNLLISIMKTDTGYSDSNCELISDATACALILSDWKCGDSGMTCLELTNKSLTEYISAFEMISKNYRYLLTVEPIGYVRREENLRILSFGDESLIDYRGKKRVANYAIQKSMAGSPYNLKARLYIARK
jgi:hypothetical protein